METHSRFMDGEDSICRKPGTTPEVLVAIYNERAKDSGYDKYVHSRGYEAPGVLAAALAGYLPDRRDVRLLDVGAGTGLVAKKLKQYGFSNIDGLDPSPGMLQAAEKQDLYKEYICEFFTNSVSAISTSAYDVLVSCGSMFEGHLKCDTLPEMIRCVKTGGLVILVARENDVLTIPEYKDRLEPLMKELEDERKWMMLERRVFPGYLTDIPGVVFVFRITK